MDLFYILKSLHFIALISWFAGLFYFPRLLIYHTEALEKEEPARSTLATQLGLMQHKLYRIIMNPAMMATFAAGFGMIAWHEWQNPGGYFVHQTWLQVKLLFLLGLLAYHLYCKKLMLSLEQGKPLLNSYRLRLFNELATLLLLGIVLLAVFKNLLHFGYALISLLLFGILLVLAVRAYRKARLRAEQGGGPSA